MLALLWSSGESCVALAALLFSVSSLFVKLTSPELSVLEICTLSSSGCALAILLLARAWGQPLWGTKLCDAVEEAAEAVEAEDQENEGLALLGEEGQANGRHEAAAAEGGSTEQQQWRRRSQERVPYLLPSASDRHWPPAREPHCGSHLARPLLSASSAAHPAHPHPHPHLPPVLPPPLHPGTIAALIALRAGLGAATLLCYYAAVEMTDIRDATALFFTSPLFALLFEWAIHRRLPSRYSAVGAAFAAAGALLISNSCFCMVFRGSQLCPDLPDVTAPSPTPLLVNDHQAGLPPHAAPLDAASGFEAAATAVAALLHAAASLLFGPSGASTADPDVAPSLPQPHHLLLATPSSSVPSLRSSFPSFLSSTPTEPSYSSSSPPSMDSLGLALAVIAAATNALAFVTIQALGPAVSALALTFWLHFATATSAAAGHAALVLWALRGRGGSGDEGGDAGQPAGGAGDFFWPGPRDAALVAGILAAQLLAQLLINRGFSLTTPTRGAAFNVLQVVFSFVWDLSVLGNQLQATSLAGGLLIVVGVLVQTSSAARRQQRILQAQLSRQWSLQRPSSSRRYGSARQSLDVPRGALAGDESVKQPPGFVAATVNGEAEGPVLVLVANGSIQPLRATG